MALANTGPMTVSGSVVANGVMNVTVDGALTVTAIGQIPPPTPGFPPTPRFASLSSSGGQNISARSLQVSAQDGGQASISNQGTGDQTITVSGGAGIDVVSESGFASINQNAAGLAQTIAVTNADHINLNGAGGNAFIFANGGAQTRFHHRQRRERHPVGQRRRARFLADRGAGRQQSITAGLAGQQGSITIVGTAGQWRHGEYREPDRAGRHADDRDERSAQYHRRRCAQPELCRRACSITAAALQKITAGEHLAAGRRERQRQRCLDQQLRRRRSCQCRRSGDPRRRRRDHSHRRWRRQQQPHGDHQQRQPDDQRQPGSDRDRWSERRRAGQQQRLHQRRPGQDPDHKRGAGGALRRARVASTTAPRSTGRSRSSPPPAT